MWPYWLLFLIPAYFAITRLRPIMPFPQNGRKGRWPIEWWGIFVLLILMIGLRHKVGGDWTAYINNLDDLAGGTLAEVLATVDPAFAIIYWVAIKTGLGIYLVNVLSAAFFTWGLIIFCRAQPRPWLALAVAVPYLITVVAMGYTRQGVAIGVAMIGMVALEQGSVLRFVFCIALAAAFHKSAVILVPLGILANPQHRVRSVLVVAAASFALFAVLLQNYLDYFQHGYLDDQYQSSGAAIRVIMNALPAAIFLIFRKRFNLTPSQKIFWTWMSWAALVFVVLLKLSPSSTAVDRVALYWIPVQLFVLSRLPNALGQRSDRNAVWVSAVVAYSAAVLFVWLVFADNATAWLPYQFYPVVWLWQ
jgi:hypothetical protein